jgi:peptide/nickel transport system substrate-binding protein
MEVRSSQFGNLAPIFQAPYDGLATALPNGSLKPNLALSWTYDKTLTHLTLKLRKGVKFTNGEVFNAAAVKANLLAFQKGDSPDASNAASIVSVTVKNAQTAIVNLKDIDPAFVAYLGRNMGLMQAPKTIGTDAAKSTPVGSGMYVLDTANTVPSSSYVYTANPGYWNPSVRKFDTITIKIISDATAQANALRAGQIDASSVSQSTVDSLKAAGLKDATQNLDWWGLTLVDRAGRMGSPLKNVKVRQAINYATNREAMRAVANNGIGLITSTPFASYSKGYDSAVANYYTYDVAKAKALLTEAGYPNGFTLEMPSTAVLGANVYQAVKDQLGAIGITVNYTDVPLNQFFATILTPKFPAYYMRLERSGNDWQFINFLIGRDAVWNPSGFGDAKSDALLSQIQHSTGAVQAKALKALNKYITEQAWFVPWFAPDANYVYNPAKVKVTVQSGNIVPLIPYGIVPAN